MNTPLALDGNTQLVLLSIVIAVIGYLRAYPLKELRDALKNEAADKKRLDVRLQIAAIHLIQLTLAFVMFLLVYRIWKGDASNDSLILFIIFILSVILFLLHLITDIWKIGLSIFYQTKK